MTICPNIVEENLIVDMDYPLTFLEFYEVMLLCVMKQTDKIIMQRKKEKVHKEVDIEEIVSTVSSGSKPKIKGARSGSKKKKA